eukprot:4109502-Prymnesium_polylepis.2
MDLVRTPGERHSLVRVIATPTPQRSDVPMKICMFSPRPVARSILKKAGADDIASTGCPTGKVQEGKPCRYVA